MNLSSGTQSLIAGALFDFIGHLTTRPKTIRSGASEAVYDIQDALVHWAAERGLGLDEAMVQDWNTQPGQVTIASLAGGDQDERRRIAGALVDFAAFAEVAGAEDPEKAALQWATKTGLEIHDPQRRWQSTWWA